MRLKNVFRTLAKLGLDAWSILYQEQEKNTLHLTNGEVETGIESVRTQAEVTVYHMYGKKMGDAKFTLFTDDETEIADKVKDALVIAGTAKKPAWPLPGKERYARIRVADPEIVAAFADGKNEVVTLKLWNALRRVAAKERRIALNHAELHLTRTKNTVMNSRGLKGQSEHTTLFVEIIIAARKNGIEQEFHHALTYGRLAEFDPHVFVKEAVQAARDVVAAEEWKGMQNKGIVLRGVALRDFWAPDLTQSPIVMHANAQAKHRHLSVFAQGRPVTRNKGFTLTSDPFVPYNPASGRFDNEGTPSRRIVLVDKGVCAGFVANQRFAHYVGVPPTGALGVIELALGEEDEAKLFDPGTVEIVSFSSFVPNSLSGDFSAEIRLGYKYTEKGKVPIRGVMFSGNVFRMLDAMRLSKESMTMERYKGPRTVRFDAGCHLAGF